MNLLLSFPDGIDKSEVLFSLPYNLNRYSKKVNGHVVCTKEKINIYLDNELINSYLIDDYDEFACDQLIGCSMMVGKKGEEKQFFCAFTQDMFLRFAELCKILDFYKRTGEFVIDNNNEELVCEKCGMPLDGAKECPYCASKGKIFLKLVKRTAPYKWYFVIAVICTVLTQLLSVINPALSRILIDDYVTPMKYEPKGFLLLCFGIVGIMALSGIFDYFNTKCSFKVALGVGEKLKQDAFDKSQRLSMSSVSKRTAGELINRVSNDTAKIQDFVTANGKEAVVQILTFIIISIIVFSMNWKLALLAVIPIPIVMVIFKKIYNLMNMVYGRVWRYGVRHSSILHDILNGIKVVKSYGNEKREIERYEKASRLATKYRTKAELMVNYTYPAAYLFISLGNFLVLYYGGKLVLNETMTLGTLIQFTSYISMLYGPIFWIVRMPRVLADTAISASKVFEILEEESDVRDVSDPIDLDIQGDIEFDDVYFGYKVYNPVLKGITCKINKGEMIGIVGHSGVGKSTMINLILRLYDCTQGAIKIDGVNIKDISQQSLRNQIGVVLQETFLFEGSILENITYANPKASFEDVVRAAKIANAHDFIVKLPDGYNTKVGNKGHTLSGGERQRIAIARAILHNPKIIILDEATASLDTQTEKQIQEALGRLTKGRTTIAIAHRLSTLSNADKLIVLDKGKLAEFGTHEELMRNKSVYYKLVMAQRQTTKMKKVEKTALN